MLAIRVSLLLLVAGLFTLCATTASAASKKPETPTTQNVQGDDKNIAKDARQADKQKEQKSEDEDDDDHHHEDHKDKDKDK